MSLESAKAWLAARGLEDHIHLFDESSATVELAAKALGTEPGRIAKSLTFLVDDGPIMILAAGNVKIDNAKYRHYFHAKAKMLTYEQVDELIGHPVGGVCPFGIKENVVVYLDESLKQFDVVYPAAGTANSAVELTIEELERASGFKAWIDVTKLN